jgi:type VI secretion system ImpM family protein
MQDTSPPRPGLFSRLKDGLRGSSSKGSEPVHTVRVSLNAYGKLPIYKDFISAGLTEPGTREFRNWIDRGFSHRWSSDDAMKETSIPRHLFLLRLPESGISVTGCLWGSGDEGGLRRFPFTLFAALPDGHPAAEPLAAAEHLEVLNRTADRVVSTYGPGGSLADFYRDYRGAAVDLPARSARRVARETRADLEKVTVASFASSMLGSGSPGAWPALLGRLKSIAERRDESAGAVRLRLSGAIPRPREIQFWLLWLANESRRRPVTGMLFPADPTGCRVTLFFRDLRPEDFLLLHPSRTDYPFVEELSAIPQSPSETASGAAPLAADDRPLSELLEA